MRMNKKTRISLIIILTSTVTFAAVVPFVESLDWGFVWDDKILISENPYIDDPLIARKMLFSDYFTYSSKRASSDYWRPLSSLSFLLDYQIHGKNPFGYHLTNLIVYGLFISAVFLLFRSISGGIPMALAGTLLYAWHPLRTETVAWISGRTEILTALFGTLMLLTFGKSLKVQKGKIPWLLTALFFFILSLAAKESGLMFLVIACILYFKHIKKRPLMFLLLFLPAAPYILLRHEVVNSIGTWHAAYVELSLLPALVLRVFLHYFIINIFPVGLNTEPWIRIPESYFEFWVIAGGAVLAGMLIIIFFTKTRLVRTGLLWFIAGLAPFLQILALPVIAADRFSTISSMGLSLAVAGFIYGSPLLQNRKRLRSVALIALLCITGFLGLISFRLNRSWKNDAALQKRAAEYGQSARALYWAGEKHYIMKQYETAVEYFRKAAKREEKPSKRLYFTLALAELDSGEIDAAEAHLRKTLELDRRHKQAGQMLAELLMRRKKYDEALERLQQFIRIYPKEPVPYLLLAKIYIDVYPDKRKAKRNLHKALQNEPNKRQAEWAREQLRRLR